MSKKITLFLILSSLSVYSEEELTLDEEIPPTAIKKEEKSQNNTVPTIKPTPFFLEISALFQKKEYAKVTSLLWSKIESLSRPEMLFLVKAHYQAKEYSESIRAANLMIAKDAKDEEAHTYIGLNLLKKNKAREAKEYFKKATDINPVYSPAIEGLAEIYLKNKNFYELRLIYLDLIKKIGDKPHYLNQLCDINTKDASNDAAIEFCNKAINLDPLFPDNHINLGLIYKNINDLEKAKSQLQTAATKFPSSDLAQYQYALLLEEQKNYIEAFKHYSLCSKLKADEERCWAGLATAGYQLSKFDESYASLKKACLFNKKNSIIGRKAAVQARNAKQLDWAKKFEKLSDICGN